MKNNLKFLLFFVVLLITYGNVFAQIEFEPGYIVDNAGNKTECLVKNVDWRNNPYEIKYKLNDSGETMTATIDSVKEFGVKNYLKYERHTVSVDRSNTEIDKLSKQRSPEFEIETLFLKVLVEGKGTLFSYRGGNSDRFFFRVDSSVVEQLIYKQYEPEDFVIGENKAYLQQLINMNSNCINKNQTMVLKYYQKDLTKYFIKYNDCFNSPSSDFEKKQDRDVFNLALRPGIRKSWLNISNESDNNLDVDYPSAITFTFGIEAEWVFAFNKEKWALIAEPTYQYYRAKNPTNTYPFDVDYASIELPIGIKYNMFLSDKSKLFITASFVLVDIPFNSTIGRLDVNTRNNMIFGLGYKYNNKLGLEMRYSTGRQMLGDYILFDAAYQSLSLVVGYNLF